MADYGIRSAAVVNKGNLHGSVLGGATDTRRAEESTSVAGGITVPPVMKPGFSEADFLAQNVRLLVTTTYYFFASRTVSSSLFYLILKQLHFAVFYIYETNRL